MDTNLPMETSQTRVSHFQVGDLVALRSNPTTILPVIEVILGSGECRYRVFQNNITYGSLVLQAGFGNCRSSVS